MRRTVVVALAVILLLGSAALLIASRARASKPRAHHIVSLLSHPRRVSPRPATAFGSHRHTKRYVAGAERDRRGRIKRRGNAKHRFEVATGHPHGWPGHVVDHIIPLCKGGRDDPSNMQWQTIEDARRKDRTECR